tara:strand:+ start:162 stop:656 length:495 start_codon:yes stop_codon:yes gene_type:complete
MRFYIIIFFIFISGCSGVEFLVGNNFNFLDGKTTYSTAGNKSEYLTEALNRSFGIAKTKDTTYILSAKNSENKTNAVIGTNQVSSDVNYSINISYTLESLNQNCIVDLKVISTKFSIKPKSEGFNFGSDRSLESLYKRNIFSNVQRYKSYLNSLNSLDKCIDEN